MLNAEKGHHGAQGPGRYPRCHPQRQAPADRWQEHLAARRLPHGGRRAPPGHPGHLGPDRRAGADQPGLCRRAHPSCSPAAWPTWASAWARARTAWSRAAKQAISSPLLETQHRRRQGPCSSTSPAATPSASWRSTKAASLIAQAADADANIIFGAGIDETFDDEVRITVIATGFEGAEYNLPKSGAAAQPAAQPQRTAPAAQQNDGVTERIPVWVRDERSAQAPRQSRLRDLNTAYEEPRAGARRRGAGNAGPALRL